MPEANLKHFIPGKAPPNRPLRTATADDGLTGTSASLGSKFKRRTALNQKPRVTKP